MVATLILAGSLVYAGGSRAGKAEEKMLTKLAKGTFEVKLMPQGEADSADGVSLSRMSIDKQFHGDLHGASKGEMLSATTGVQESAGYVAIERVSGTLEGRTGSFVLQHSGVMNRGTPELRVIVVPDSGTGQLKGLAGSMTIKIENGKHFYEFGYILPEN
jgi:hypothetical protein